VRSADSPQFQWQLYRSSGAESLAGVLGQCPALAHLDLWNNQIGDARNGVVVNPPHPGTERLLGVLAQCPALAHLNLGINRIGEAGAEWLAGVLVQCTSLAHLNLRYNKIYLSGNLEGVLTQCTALTHLNLSGNGIGHGAVGLRASWRGQASGLVL